MPVSKIYVTNFCSNEVLAFRLGSNGQVLPVAPPRGAGLADPLGLALDSSDNLYVANHCNGVVNKYAAGATGNVPPIRSVVAASDPRGVAVDSSGNIYVANFSLNAIDIITPAGGHVLLTGSNTQLHRPFGVAINPINQEIYVTNFGSSTITVYNAGASGNVSPVTTISGPDTQLGAPTGIALDASGEIFVVNSVSPTGTGSILMYPHDSTGDAAPSISISSFSFDFPWGLGLDSDGSVWVSNENGTYVTQFAVTPTPTTTPAPTPTPVIPNATIFGADTDLAGPTGLALDSASNIYVANNLGPSVTIYPPSSNGDVPPAAAIHGNFATTLLGLPVGIAEDLEGQLYVGNFNDDTVTVYAPGTTANKAPVETLEGPNTGLNGPTGIALDSTGRLYVANFMGGTVTIYNSASFNGDLSPESTITGLNGPIAVALDRNEDIYVASGNDNSIKVFARVASSIQLQRTIAGANTLLHFPYGITVDSGGNIFAASNGNNLLLAFKPTDNGNVSPAAQASYLDVGGLSLVDSNGHFYLAQMAPSNEVTELTFTSGQFVRVSQFHALRLASPQSVVVGP